MNVDGTPQQFGTLAAQVHTIDHPPTGTSRTLFHSPMKEAIAQLDARFDNLERFYRHRLENAIAQPTAAELELKREVDFIVTQLRQLSVTLPVEIDTRIAQTVGQHQQRLTEVATTAQQQAALTQHAAQHAVSASAHIHQQAQQIAQTQAHLLAALSTAHAITNAENPTVESQSHADEMHVDEYSCDYADKSSNPKLPHYTGAEDPGIWSMQVQACFHGRFSHIAAL